MKKTIVVVGAGRGLGNGVKLVDALRVGYRSIDTAQCYGNECEVGFACKNSGIPRS